MGVKKCLQFLNIIAPKNPKPNYDVSGDINKSN